MLFGSRQATYERFLKALMQAQLHEARDLTAPNFSASFGGPYTNMTFEQLAYQFERQRTAFPDLGQYTEVMDVQELDAENRLIMTYMMTVHFTGTLTNGEMEVRGNGGAVVIPSQDRVDFDSEGKIHYIEVVTDMGYTMNQLFRQM